MVCQLVILGVVGHNYIRIYSKGKGALEEDPSDPAGPGWEWCHLGVKMASKAIPMPTDTEASLCELQNDIGEMADDLEVAGWIILGYRRPWRSVC